MEYLYPKDYVKPEAVEEAVKDTKTLKTFIKGLVAEEPMLVEKIVDACDQKYVETNDEKYHFTTKEIATVCKEIDEEFRPVPVVEEVVEAPVEV